MTTSQHKRGFIVCSDGNELVVEQHVMVRILARFFNAESISKHMSGVGGDKAEAERVYNYWTMDMNAMSCTSNKMRVTVAEWDHTQAAMPEKTVIHTSALLCRDAPTIFIDSAVDEVINFMNLASIPIMQSRKWSFERRMFAQATEQHIEQSVPVYNDDGVIVFYGVVNQHAHVTSSPVPYYPHVQSPDQVMREYVMGTTHEHNQLTVVLGGCAGVFVQFTAD